MEGIKNRACIPSSSWNRLRKLYGNEKVDYYNLLDESYIAAKQNGSLTERENEYIEYDLIRNSTEGKPVHVRYTPNRYKEKNPQWIWYLEEIREVPEPVHANHRKHNNNKVPRVTETVSDKKVERKEYRVVEGHERTQQVKGEPKHALSAPTVEERAAKSVPPRVTRTTSHRKGKAADAPLKRIQAPATTKDTALLPAKTTVEYRSILPIEMIDDQDIEPNAVLKKFAWLGAEVDFYNDLYTMMMSEPWYFSMDPQHISLASYIKYTFYRLQTEEKIVYSIDEQYAAFNTGLVDTRDNEIYALFSRDDGSHQQQWVYCAFCIRGTGNGKIISERFAEFPEKAGYDLDDRLRAITKETYLDVDYQHIVIANAGRLPEEMLVEESDKKTKSPLKNILEQRRRMMAEGKTAEVNEQNRKLGTLVAENTDFQNRLLDRLEEHVKVAQNRVDQNPAIAIPVYYPGKNTMSVVLPLYRNREDDIAYGALVVGITKAGNYQAHTILTPQMAYVDARIVRPIDSLWLIKSYLHSTEHRNG